MATTLALDPTTEQLAQQAMAHCQSGEIDAGIGIFRRLTDIEPDAACYWGHLGAALTLKGDIDGGISSFQKALEIDPDDVNAVTSLLHALSLKHDRASRSGDRRLALETSRQILAIDPDHFPTRTNLFEYLADDNERSGLADFSPQLKPEDIGTKILIACMPKSGSTWLNKALQRMTGYGHDQYTLAYLQNEQEIYLPRVIASAREHAIIQQHCRATAPNVSILQAFGIRPIVLIRNLLDALISMQDFYNNGAVRNTFHRADWSKLDEETKRDLIVETVAPWYVQFYASWVRADGAEKLPVLWISYEDMIGDKPGTLSKIAAHYGQSVSEACIKETISGVDGDRADTRFNKGRAGRGAEAFSAEQQDRIRALTRFYPSVDFSPIGL